jgi:hypothetical protein
MKRAAELRNELAALTARLYDARTPARERRDLSMEVAVLRAQLGALDIDTLAAESGEEEEEE